MIVKNESKVIERCLESVRPLIDYALIEDTGSTDGTQAIIRKWLDRAGLRGEVWDEPWQDFAYNRSHALTRLREIKWVDYALIMDADDQLVIEPDFDVAVFKIGLNDILCDVELRRSGTRYWRVQICSNKHEFRYRGVLHEFIEGPPGPLARSTVSGFYIETGREGARSQDPDKYRKDAALLETALKTETDEFLRSRYTFYLARSYRDAGENEKALPHFLKRAELGYWNEEIFTSLYNAGQIQEALGRPFQEVIATYLRASEAAPSRAEALHAASRLCRVNDRFADGYEYARRGLAIPPPSGGLFLEPWPYDYALLDEFAVSAYWIGRYQDCLDACERLLREGKIPASVRERIQKNAEFAQRKLAEAAAIKKPAVLESTVPFPEVLVINLDHRTDRWATIERTCAAANLTPVRMPAIKSSPGWHGSGLSHLKCIRLAKERNLPWVLILEDDATFTPEAIGRFRGLLGYLWENRGHW
jgi:hypothetical protein